MANRKRRNIFFILNTTTCLTNTENSHIDILDDIYHYSIMELVRPISTLSTGGILLCILLL